MHLNAAGKHVMRPLTVHSSTLIMYHIMFIHIHMVKMWKEVFIASGVVSSYFIILNSLIIYIFNATVPCAKVVAIAVSIAMACIWESVDLKAYHLYICSQLSEVCIYCQVYQVGSVTNNFTRVWLGYRIYSLW
jgi:hypothetical protein